MRVCKTEKDRPAYEGQRHHGGIRKAPFGNFIKDGKPDMIKDAYECAVEYYKDFQSIKGKRSNSIALLRRER